MTMDVESDVQWFRRHLVPAAAGLLEDAEAGRFQALAQEDPLCRELLASFLDDPEATRTTASEDRHIPAALLARWPRVQRDLAGLEREIAAHHLATCEECRADLRLLGFDPSLPQLGETRTRSAPVHPMRTRRDPIRVFLGSWALLATAATLLLLVLEGIPRSPSDAASRPAAAEPEMSLIAEIRLPEPERGGEGETPDRRVGPTEPLYLSIHRPPPPADVEEDADFPVAFELKDPTGATLATLTTRSAEIPRGATLRVHPPRPWVGGIYELAVRAGQAAPPAISRFRLVIVGGEPRSP